jgi:hypothetical protein
MTERVTEEAYKLLTEGYTPHLISKRLSISIENLLRDFNRLVGEGRIRRVDILYSVPGERRARIEKVKSLGPLNIAEVAAALRERHLDDLWRSEEEMVSDIMVVISYGDARFVLDEMYEEIRAIEVVLNDYVERKLKLQYGNNLEEWWIQGDRKSVV